MQPVDYASVSTLSAHVAALQSDIVGNARFAHYGNLTTAATTTYVETTVTDAVDDLDDLSELEF